jgi:hypothetical protein
VDNVTYIAFLSLIFCFEFFHLDLRAHDFDHHDFNF